MRILLISKGISNKSCMKVLDMNQIDYDCIDETDEINSLYDLVIKGPGVSYDNKIVKQHIEKNVLVITDIELAYWFFSRKYIAITGSNGKTSTAIFLNHFLDDSVVCGNIGYPLIECLLEENKKNLIVEVSSFQLKGTHFFKPSISIITNLNPCHLDYHKSSDDYFNSKIKIFKNQRESDYVILNLDCNISMKFSKEVKCRLLTFSEMNKEANCYIYKNYIYFENKKVVKLNKKITNYKNLLPTIIVAKLHNYSNKIIKKKMKCLPIVHHRMEYVKKNVINDSKSTNIYSTINAIKSISSNIVLLCGGSFRETNLSDLEPYLCKLSLVVTYGESKNILYDFFKSKNISVIKCIDFSQSVNIAKKNIYKKDVLLFSPMYPSYDLFSSFEERGEKFKSLIKG